MSLAALSLVANNTLAIASGLNPELVVSGAITMTTSLIKAVKYLSNISYMDTELQQILLNSDILQDITIIKTYIEEKKHLQDNESVKMCISSLNETLASLEQTINSITYKLEKHKKLWFNSFRSYHISKEKEQIPILIKQLNLYLNRT
jgi:phenylalanyl-tRNA synthetase alpha subunit